MNIDLEEIKTIAGRARLFAEIDSGLLMQLCLETASLREHNAELDRALRLNLAVAEDDPVLITDADKDIFQLRELNLKLKTVAHQAMIQMVRMGNEMNWEPPMDQEFVDALNAIRELVKNER